MKRKSFESNHCSVARGLDVIGDWWSLLIVRDAIAGIRRFSDYQRKLGVAKNILSSRLRTLVAHGILEQVPAEDGSAYQEYVPTEKGRALLPVLQAIGQWGREYLFEPDDTCAFLVDKEHGEPLQKLELRASDGRLLQSDEIRFITRTAGQA